MTSLAIPSLARDALFAKSQVYIRRAFRAQTAGENDEFQLWASLSLELLGKAALAKVHPSLIADPLHYQSLFAACGKPLSLDIKTITAKTLFERLTHLEKNFDTRRQSFCDQLALRRNSELHSGESPFMDTLEDSWQGQFWGAAESMLRMQDETLETWLGTEDAKAPAEIIRKAEEAIAWAVSNRIERHSTDFIRTHKSAVRKKMIVDSKNTPWDDQTWDARERHECPSCTALGYLGGTFWCEEVEPPDGTPPDWDSTADELADWQINQMFETVIKTYGTEAFHCPVCELNLSGTLEIAAAGLPEDFERSKERERDYGPEYGND